MKFLNSALDAIIVAFIILIVAVLALGVIADIADKAEPAVPEEATTIESASVESMTELTTEPETTQVAYEMYFTLEDVEMVAKTIYGEAGSSWITREDKACVAWVICNRVDDYRWANTIAGVITSPKQFYGYRASNPVTDECRDIALDVLTRWSLEKQGVDINREISSDINSFYGDGRSNHFYAAK